MNPQANKTIRFYDEHAIEYARKSVALDLESLYAPFLKQIPNGGRILDAGCGSGRDAKVFLERDYEVVAIDGSAAMAHQAAMLLERPVEHCPFQEMGFVNEFDGIWCCAALLHVRRLELSSVLRRFAIALRQRGVCYLSFNEGHGERDEDRYFIDFTATELRHLFTEVEAFDVVDIWVTPDYRGSRRPIKWINTLVQKR